MNTARVAVAALTLLLAAVHSYLGERYILIRLFRRADLPKLFGSEEFTRRTLRFAWHLTSVAYLGLAAVLLSLPLTGGAVSRAPAQTVAVTFAISAVVAIVGSKGRHLSWIVFLALAALAWYS
jgi:hypothetical protein